MHLTPMSSHRREIFSIFYNLRNNGTLNQLINLVEEFSRELNTEEEKHVFKGNVLEVFSEIFFNNFRNDPAIGLRDYVPMPSDQDYGVDATAKNVNDQNVVVQVKYRRNPEDLITYADISKTFTHGELILGLDLKEDNSIYLFTTSSGITTQCNTVFGTRLMIINRPIIQRSIDNNINFWKQTFGHIYNFK